MVIDKEYSGAKEVILPVSSLWVSCVGTAAAVAAHSFNLSTVSADDSTISFTHLREKTPCLLFRISRVNIQRICLIVYVKSGRVKYHDAFHLDNKNPVSVLLDSSEAGFAHYYKCAEYRPISFWCRLYRDNATFLKRQIRVLWRTKPAKINKCIHI